MAGHRAGRTAGIAAANITRAAVAFTLAESRGGLSPSGQSAAIAQER
jgi:hypothetical protein